MLYLIQFRRTMFIEKCLSMQKEKIEAYFEGTIILDTEDPYFSLRKNSNRSGTRR